MGKWKKRIHSFIFEEQREETIEDKRKMRKQIQWGSTALFFIYLAMFLISAKFEGRDSFVTILCYASALNFGALAAFYHHLAMKRKEKGEDL